MNDHRFTYPTVVPLLRGAATSAKPERVFAPAHRSAALELAQRPQPRRPEVTKAMRSRS